MKVKRKVIGILLCMLMLAAIPLAAGISVTPETEDTAAIGRTVCRGLFFNFKTVGLKNQFFALRVHYTEVTGTETTTGVVRMRRVQVGKWTGGYLREIGPLGMFGYMGMATFTGGIDTI